MKNLLAFFSLIAAFCMSASVRASDYIYGDTGWNNDLPPDFTAEDTVTIAADTEFPVGKGFPGCLIIDSGVTLTITFGGLESGKVANNGTIAFVGGTAEAPIAIVNNSSGTTGFGKITIAANSYVCETTESGNRQYDITGAGVSSHLTLTCNYISARGMTADSTIRNLSLKVAGKSSLYLKYDNIFDSSVDLELEADIFVDNSNSAAPPNIVVGSLSGTGYIAMNNNSIPIKFGSFIVTQKTETTYTGKFMCPVTVDAAAAALVFNGSFGMNGRLILKAGKIKSTNAYLNFESKFYAINGRQIEKTTEENICIYTFIWQVASVGEQEFSLVTDALNFAKANPEQALRLFDPDYTIDVAAGERITVNPATQPFTLTGAGEVTLSTFPSQGVFTPSETWRGTVVLPATTEENIKLDTILNAYGNADSTVRVLGIGRESSTMINGVGFLDPEGTIVPKIDLVGKIYATGMYFHTLEEYNVYMNRTCTFNCLTGSGDLVLAFTLWDDSQRYITYSIKRLENFTGSLCAYGMHSKIKINDIRLATAPAAASSLVVDATTTYLGYSIGGIMQLAPDAKLYFGDSTEPADWTLSLDATGVIATTTTIGIDGDDVGEASAVRVPVQWIEAAGGDASVAGVNSVIANNAQGLTYAQVYALGYDADEVETAEFKITDVRLNENGEWEIATNCDGTVRSGLRIGLLYSSDLKHWSSAPGPFVKAVVEADK